MSTPSPHLSPEADAIRAAERAAIQRLARNVASRAARAAGYKDAAEVSIGFIDMVLTEAFAARDAELDSERRKTGSG
ncbi:MAG: hypothetical protein HYX51_02150 [Chloroflexi bacterium]|nr:hypothetical protein [Chloroflexota bacterium]